MPAPRRILVVEDDKHFASQLKELLEFHGHDVVLAHSGPEGLSSFRDNRIDFILMDVMLPNVHGIRVLEQIRGETGGVDVPAILMSAVYRSEALFERDMRRLGVLQFLAKPFSLLDLGRHIEQLLELPDRGREKVREILRDAAASASITGFVPTVDDDSFEVEVEVEVEVEAPPPPRPKPQPKPARTSSPAVRRPIDPSGQSMSEIPAVMRQADALTADDSQIQIDTGRRLPRIGDLDPSVYVQLLTTLFHSHSSARLVLREEPISRTMYLLNGYPVWVEVSEPMAGLPAFLVREGLIDRDAAMKLAEATGQGSSGLRRRLVELGILEPSDLDAALEAWISAEVRDGLGRVGLYQLNRSDDFAGTVPVYEVNPIRALWSGLPKFVKAAQVREQLDGMAERQVGRTRTFNRLYGYIATTPLLRQLGDALRDPRTLREIRGRFPDAGGEVSLCLWFLIHAGLLALSDSPQPARPSSPGARKPAARRPRPSSQPARERPLPAAAVTGAARAVTEQPVEFEIEFQTSRHSAKTVSALREATPKARTEPDKMDSEAIVRDYITRIDLDHYGFLGIDEDANGEQIDAAYQRLAPRWRLRNLGEDVQGDVRRQAKELLARLVRTFDELSQPKRRAAYDSRLERERRVQTRTSSRSGTSSFSTLTEETDFASVSQSGMDAVPDATSSFLSVDMGEDPVGDWWPGSEAPAALSKRRSRMNREDGDVLVKAHAAMARSDFKTAVAALEGLRARFPSDSGILAELGWCRFALSPRDPRAIDKALEWADLALAFRPDSPTALEVKARILCATPRNDDAIVALKRLAPRKPDSAWLRSELARRDQNADEAVKARGGLRRLWGKRK